jgi:hypothetical protein
VILVDVLETAENMQLTTYRYEDQDNVHFDGFRWIDRRGNTHKFPPNSDKSFTDFRRIIQKEWEKACGRSQ